MPSEIIESEYITDLGVYGNALSGLRAVDGSEICVRVASTPSVNDPIASDSIDAVPFGFPFGVMGGEHYCDCSSNCIPVVDRPNLCECEEAKSCCDEFLSQYTECIVCEYGIANPSFFVEQFGFTCSQAVEYVRTSILEFGTEETCNTARNMGMEFGCMCNTEQFLNAGKDLDV